MNIVSWEALPFSDGSQLQIPVLSNGVLPTNDEYDFIGKCGVYAYRVGHTNSEGTIEEFLGLPVGYENALIDPLGNRWYVERTITGNVGSRVGTYRYHFGSINGPSMTNISLDSGNSVIAGNGFIVRDGVNNSNYTIYSPPVNYVNGYGTMDYNPYTGVVSYYEWHRLIGKSDPEYLQAAYYSYCGNAYGAMYGTGLYFKLFARREQQNINNGGAHQIGRTQFSQYILINIEPSPYDTDPNSQGGYTKTGGGTGNFDRTSDAIQVPSLPTLNATKAGFVTLYKPTLSDLLNLSEYLWSTNIIDILIQYFSNPMDIIIGLGIVPVNPTASASGFPSAGSITVPYSFPIIDSQYYELNCGAITLKEFWGSALDYAPYTQVQIYLPYIGVRELNVDEIMGKSIGVKYHIDLFGGACVAFVTVDGSVKYQFSGNCLQQIPVNAANYDQLVQNLVSVACVVGSGIAASGGAGVAAAVGSESAALGAGELSQSQAITKGLAGAEYADVRAAGASEWMSENGGNLNNCVVSTVMGSKPRVERTGALAATTGQLCSQAPYLIITRPEQSLPNNYKHYEGYPSNITSRLGSLSGFTKVESIRLNDLAATQPELMEIYSLLYKGVII